MADHPPGDRSTPDTRPTRRVGYKDRRELLEGRNVRVSRALRAVFTCEQMLVKDAATLVAAVYRGHVSRKALGDVGVRHLYGSYYR